MELSILQFNKLLFVLCDSSAHESISDEFIKLKNHNIDHDILFLDGETSAWLGKSKIECGGAGKLIAADENAPAPIELPKEYHGVILPEIDLDNAARVASGFRGTMKSEIIFSALILNKMVIVGEDSPGIKRSDRRCLAALSLPAPYLKLYSGYLSQMKELGIDFAPQRGLADLAIQKLRQIKKAETEDTVEADLPYSDERHSFHGRLLTADWLMSQPLLKSKTLYVQQGVIISPLAADFIKEKGIHVQVVSKG